MDLPTKCKGDFSLYLFPAGWYRNCTSHSKIWYVGFDQLFYVYRSHI